MRLRAPPPSSSREITDCHLLGQLALTETGFGAKVVDQLAESEVLLDTDSHLRIRVSPLVLDVVPAGVVGHGRLLHDPPVLGEPVGDPPSGRPEREPQLGQPSPRLHDDPGRINTWDGGRGFYFDDPNGHRLEIITRSYGTGGTTTDDPHPLVAAAPKS